MKFRLWLSVNYEVVHAILENNSNNRTHEMELVVWPLFVHSNLVKNVKRSDLRNL